MQHAAAQVQLTMAYDHHSSLQASEVKGSHVFCLLSFDQSQSLAVTGSAVARQRTHRAP
jgi:hypothetical protein